MYGYENNFKRYFRYMHIALRLKKEYSNTFSPPLGLQNLFYGDLYLYIYLYTTSSSINKEHLVS